MVSVCLVKDEVAAANNGIYVRTSATVLTRATDFDTPAEMPSGSAIYVTGGGTNGNTSWTTTAAVITVGTTAITWTQSANAWTGNGNKIATWTGSDWSYYTPVLNDQTSVLSGTNAGNVYLYSGSAWILQTVNTGIPIYAWSLASSYTAGTVVIYNGSFYQANSAIPANTAFVAGTTGATWKPVGTQIANGTSNVVIGSANANIAMSVANTPNVVVVTANSMSVNGTIYSSTGPIVGTASSYASLTRSTAQTTPLSIGSAVLFNTVNNISGSDISLNSGSGQITLQANRTYRLMGSPGYASFSGAGYVTWQWYNVTDAAYIGNPYTAEAITGTSNNAASYGPTVTMFTPSVTTVIQLNIKDQSLLTSIGGSGSTLPYADIEVIGGQIAQTQISLKTITKIDQMSYGTTLYMASNRLYAIKNNSGGVTNSNSGLGVVNPNNQTGVANAYEIVFPNETVGTLTDAGTYGLSAYALFSSGNLYTWGENAYGQLGLGNTTDVFIPTLSNTSVAEVYAHPSQCLSDPNYSRLIIRKTDNTYFGCGYNEQGQLGLGNTTQSHHQLDTDDVDCCRRTECLEPGRVFRRHSGSSNQMAESGWQATTATVNWATAAPQT
jgi:hypothetical protein